MNVGMSRSVCLYECMYDVCVYECMNYERMMYDCLFLCLSVCLLACLPACLSVCSFERAYDMYLCLPV